jgi:hypothetical protein
LPSSRREPGLVAVPDPAQAKPLGTTGAKENRWMVPREAIRRVPPFSGGEWQRTLNFSALLYPVHANGKSRRRSTLAGRAGNQCLIAVVTPKGAIYLTICAQYAGGSPIFFTSCPITRIRMEKVKNRIVLQENQLGGMFAIGLFEASERLLFVFRLRIVVCLS